MKNEVLRDALSQISDRHIAEAAEKRHRLPALGVLAASLALMLAVYAVVAGLSGNTQSSISMQNPNPTQNATSPTEKQEYPVPPSLLGSDEIFTPKVVQAQNLLASPQYPELTPYSDNFEQWQLWREDYRQLHSAPAGYADSLTDFFARSIPEFLSESTQNTAYSPVSLYMALSMLAQTAGGETQQEILTLLGADSAEALAEQAGLVWRNHYWNDGATTSVFANSLWLDDMFQFRESTVKTIAEDLYASVYRGALETPEMNIALKDWLNTHTGGLLEEAIYQLEGMDERTALVLASAIFYRCKWNDEFIESRNTQGIFHSPSGDESATYMNATLMYGPYVWGEDFSATCLSLEDDSRMWLILPDEGYTPQDILKNGNALDMILNWDIGYYNDSNTYPNQKGIIVNLSLPKFDVTGNHDLMPGLERLGITLASDPLQADFSGIDPANQQLFLGRANQGTRVTIDEEGVYAASYTVMLEYGSGMPPEEEVDFVLDRPFLFVVESPDGVPMFTGVVNTP